MLTDDLNNDGRYKLAKYFLQVLAGVRNDQIVVDPPVTVPPGLTVEVPFQLAETDIITDVSFLTPLPDAIQMTMVTPDADDIHPGFMAGVSGRNHFKVGREVLYYRLTLPAPIGRGAHEGEWKARFRLDEGRLQEAVAKSGGGFTRDEVRRFFSEGVVGTLLVHASSDLRMSVDLRQDSLEPGAAVALWVTLAEYGFPVSGRARVEAVAMDPLGGQQIIRLREAGPGVFEERFATNRQGVWTVLFRAKGTTFRGFPFTREEVRTAGVWPGGDACRPEEGPEPSRRTTL